MKNAINVSQHARWVQRIALDATRALIETQLGTATIVHWDPSPTLKTKNFAGTAHWDGLPMKMSSTIGANPAHAAILAHTPGQQLFQQRATVAAVARIPNWKEGPKPVTAKDVQKVDGARQFMLRKNQLASLAGLENLDKTSPVPMH